MISQWLIGRKVGEQSFSFGRPSLHQMGRSLSPALFCRQRTTTSGSTRAPGRRLDVPSFWAIRTPFQATRKNASFTRQASSILILGILREDEILYLDVGCPQELEETRAVQQCLGPDRPGWRRAMAVQVQKPGPADISGQQSLAPNKAVHRSVLLDLKFFSSAAHPDRAGRQGYRAIIGHCGSFVDCLKADWFPIRRIDGVWDKTVVLKRRVE